MNDIFDYLKWRGDLTFGNAPLCPVDTLIFSLLSGPGTIPAKSTYTSWDNNKLSTSLNGA